VIMTHSPGVVTSIPRAYPLLCLASALLTLSGCSWLHSDAASEGPATALSKQGIEQHCSVDLDNRKPADAFGFSTPGFSVGQDALIVVGGHDARAHVYNASCKEISRTPLRNSSDSGAVILPGGLAVLGDSGGYLYGIRPESGELVWSFNLSGPLTSVPVVIGDDVLVQTLDNRIYRVSADGKKQWSFTASAGGLGLYLTPSPLVQGDKVFTVFNNGDAFALSAATGDVLWRKQILLSSDAAVLSEIKAPLADPLMLKSIAWGNDSATNAVMFSFYQGNIVMLDANDGRLLFSRELSLRSTPFVDGNIMIVADAQGRVQALDVDSGKLAWELILSKGELVGPAYFADAYWFGDNHGLVYRVDRAGKLTGTWQAGGEITHSPVASAGGVLVRTNLGALYVLQ